MTTNTYGGSPLSVANILDDERLSSVNPKLFLASVPAHPFVAWLLQDGVFPWGDWAPKHYYKERLPKKTQINAIGGYNAAEQVLTVDDASVFRPNDTVICFRTSEQMKFIRHDSETKAVVARNVDGTTYTLNDDDYLIVISPGFRHGEMIGEWATTQPVPHFSYVQSMEKVIRINVQNDGVDTLGGDRRFLEQAEKLVEFWEELERAIILNEKPGAYTTGLGYTGLSGSDLGAAASVDHPYYLSRSVKEMASDHAVTFYSGGVRQTITELDWNNLLDDHVAHSEAKGLGLLPLFISGNIKKAVNYWARGKLEYRWSDTIHGVRCGIYQCSNGDIELIDTPVLSDEVSGVGWNGAGFTITPGKSRLQTVPGHEINLEKDAVKTGVRQHVDRWTGAYGLMAISQKFVTWFDGIAGPTTS